MEDEKFDDVTRSLGEGSSRRRVIGGVLGGVLGALGLGVAAREDADAASKKITVCKGGQTKKVSAKAWRRMQLSGADAYKGKCKPPTTIAPVTTTTKAPKPTTTKHPHPKHKCGKAYDRCNKGEPPCCAHDPYTGARLRCQQGSKKGYNTCVPVDGTATTTTTAGGTATTTTTGGTVTTTTTAGTVTTTTTARTCTGPSDCNASGGGTAGVCCSTTGSTTAGICVGSTTICLGLSTTACIIVPGTGGGGPTCTRTVGAARRR